MTATRAVVWVVLGVVVAGCAPPDPPPLEPLPYHPLVINEPGATTRPAEPQHAASAVAGEKSWAVEGARPWRYIVIHHSASAAGSAATFDAMHRRRGWDSLGYHFVIDNGRGGPDGRVEVGPRWKQQKWGSHTGDTPDNAYNNFGIGICLVGNFSDAAPSAAQIASLKKLVIYLAACYDVPPQNIIGHRDAPGAKTDCPGDKLEIYVTGDLRKAVAETAKKK